MPPGVRPVEQAGGLLGAGDRPVPLGRSAATVLQGLRQIEQEHAAHGGQLPLLGRGCVECGREQRQPLARVVGRGEPPEQVRQLRGQPGGRGAREGAELVPPGSCLLGDPAAPVGAQERQRCVDSGPGGLVPVVELPAAVLEDEQDERAQHLGAFGGGARPGGVAFGGRQRVRGGQCGDPLEQVAEFTDRRVARDPCPGQRVVRGLQRRLVIAELQVHPRDRVQRLDGPAAVARRVVQRDRVPQLAHGLDHPAAGRLPGRQVPQRLGLTDAITGPVEQATRALGVPRRLLLVAELHEKTHEIACGPRLPDRMVRLPVGEDRPLQQPRRDVRPAGPLLHVTEMGQGGTFCAVVTTPGGVGTQPLEHGDGGGRVVAVPQAHSQALQQVTAVVVGRESDGGIDPGPTHRDEPGPVLGRGEERDGEQGESDAFTVVVGQERRHPGEVRPGRTEPGEGGATGRSDRPVQFGQRGVLGLQPRVGRAGGGVRCGAILHRSSRVDESLRL